MEPTTLALMFVAASQSFNLPTGLLSSLCFVESSHNVKAIHHDDGGSNSVGICELKLSTARLLGFKGTERQLMIPKDNIKYAAKYLKKQLKRYHGNISKAVAAYNAGTYRRNCFGYPKNKKYVTKVFMAWSQGR